MQISNIQIGSGNKPFLIAEMSGNHNNSLNRAMEIVQAAAKAGAHALKLQTFTADTITLDVSTKEFQIQDNNSLWNGKTLHLGHTLTMRKLRQFLYCPTLSFLL